MKKCVIMFLLWVIVLVVASFVWDTDEKLNENVIVALEIKVEPVK
jgi:hypothetical protein